MSFLFLPGEASFLNLLRLFYTKTPGDDDDKGSSGGGGTSDETKKAEAPTFTPEQQKYLDTMLLPTRLRRERERLEKELKSRGLTDEEKTELDGYRTAAREQSEKEAVAEQKRLEEQGQYKKIIADTEAKYKTQITERDEILGTLMIQLQERDIDRAIAAAITPHAAKIVPGSDRFIGMTLRNGVPLDSTGNIYSIKAELNEENGNTVIRLVDRKGVPLLNNQANEMSLSEAVSKILEMTPQFVLANMRGGSGSTGGGGNIESLKTQIEEAAKKARESGKRSDLTAYVKLRAEYKQKALRA